MADKTPINQLPTEILAAIFLECLPPSPTAAITSHPRLITAVSRLWRETAEVTPELWSNLGINLTIDCPPPGFEEPLRLQGEAIIRWLKIARNGVSVKVDIQVRNLQNELVKDLVERVIVGPMLDDILRFSNKWGSLHLGKIKEPYLSRFLCIPPHDLQSLRKLVYSIPVEFQHAVSSEGSLTGFNQSSVVMAPNLSSLSLEGLHRSNSLKDIPLARWSDIKELSLETGYYSHYMMRWHTRPISSDELFTVLRRCASSIHTLKVAIGEPYRFDTSEPTTPLVFPNLRYLDITEVGATPHLQGYMSSISLPVLRRLSFHIVKMPVTRLATTPSSLYTLFKSLAWASTVPNLSCLTDVRFPYSSLQATEFESILDIIGGPGTDLRRLSVYNEDSDAYPVYYRREMDPTTSYAIFSNRILERFKVDLKSNSPDQNTFRNQSQPLFPKLEAFECTLGLGREDEFDGQDLFHFVMNRLVAGSRIFRSISKLKHVNVFFFTKGAFNIRNELEKIVNSGDMGIVLGDFQDLKLEVAYMRP